MCTICIRLVALSHLNSLWNSLTAVFSFSARMIISWTQFQIISHCEVWMLMMHLVLRGKDIFSLAGTAAATVGIDLYVDQPIIWLRGREINPEENARLQWRKQVITKKFFLPFIKALFVFFIVFIFLSTVFAKTTFCGRRVDLSCKWKVETRKGTSGEVPSIISNFILSPLFE